MANAKPELIEQTKVCGTLYHDVADTIKEVKNTVKHLNRGLLKAVTTPQMFSKELYQKIFLKTKNKK